MEEIKCKTVAEIDRECKERRIDEITEAFEVVSNFIESINSNGEHHKYFKDDSSIIELMKLHTLMEIDNHIVRCGTKIQHIYESIQVADSSETLNDIAFELKVIRTKLTAED